MILGTVGLETLSRLAKLKFVAADDYDLVYMSIAETDYFVPRGHYVEVGKIYTDDMLPAEWYLYCIESGITADDTNTEFRGRIYTLQFSPDYSGTITISYITPYSQNSYYFILNNQLQTYVTGSSTHVMNTDMVVIRLYVPYNVSFETAKQYLKISLTDDVNYNRYRIELNNYFAIDRPTINNIIDEQYVNTDNDITAIDRATIDAIINGTYVNSGSQQDILSNEDIDLILS